MFVGVRSAVGKTPSAETTVTTTAVERKAPSEVDEGLFAAGAPVANETHGHYQFLLALPWHAASVQARIRCVDGTRTKDMMQGDLGTHLRVRMFSRMACLASSRCRSCEAQQDVSVCNSSNIF